MGPGREDQMIMRPRIAPGAVAQTAVNPQEWRQSQIPGPGTFLIEITAADGTMLLRMFERDGRLAVEGDESRWEEGARLFVDQMLQWSGAAGIRWKDAAQG